MADRRILVLLAAALATAPRSLLAQDPGGSEGAPAPRKVVVDEESGDVHLAPLVSMGGFIHDTAQGTALGGARIELHGTGRSFSTRSAEDGRFRLSAVPAGRYTLRITRMGYEPVVLENVPVMPELGEAGLIVAMSQRTVALSEMVITPGQFGLLQRSVTDERSMSRESLESVPQLGEDIYRAVSRAPGVTTDDFSAKFGVRGASGD